jgi:hypothetical protein
VELAHRWLRCAPIADQVEAHQARIAGKRLRYVLEPLASKIEGAPAIIARLKALQDGLGRCTMPLFRRLPRAGITDRRRRNRHGGFPASCWRGPPPRRRRGKRPPVKTTRGWGWLLWHNGFGRRPRRAYAELKSVWLDAVIGLVAGRGCEPFAALTAEPAVSLEPSRPGILRVTQSVPEASRNHGRQSSIDVRGSPETSS